MIPRFVRQVSSRRPSGGPEAKKRVETLPSFIAAAAIAVFAGLPAEAASPSFDLALSPEQASAEVRVITVQQGDDVTLHLTADRPIEIHLHGYDIEETVLPGKAVAMRFTARATGRFPIEIHGRGTARVVAYLEVHPR
jgi:hypothetical protein